MTSPRMQILERQLLKTASAPVGTASASTDKILTSIQAAVEEEVKVAIKAAEDRQHAAEAEVVDLRKQIASLNSQLIQTQKYANDKAEGKDEVTKREMQQMNKDHATGMQGLQSQITALQKALVNEQHARVKAEAQMAAADKLHDHLQETITTLKAKPVAAPAAVVKAAAVAAVAAVAPVKEKPVEFRVQHDEMGRIVSITATR